jgi:hypothetical protein
MGKDAASLARKAASQLASTARESPEDITVIGLSAERCEIAAPSDKVARLIELLTAAGAEKIGSEVWDRLGILSGIPTVTPATQEAFVPQMVNLDLIGGVSFEKGCYPGQEIVARMHYRGTLKQRMYLAHGTEATPPQAGDKLYSPAFGEQASGTIVSAARSPEGGFDALAVIQTAAAGKREIRWNSPDGPALTLLPLPYPIPE